MAAEMSCVDVLVMAQGAAGMLRSSRDPETALANAYAALGRQPPEATIPLAVRIVQLVLDAGEDRQRLHEYLRRIAGPLAWDRPRVQGEPAAVVQEDPAARRYVEMWGARQLGTGHSLFASPDGCPHYPSFRLLGRAAVGWFEGPVVVHRQGQELSAEQAGLYRPDDQWDVQRLELPSRVQGLIDYPFEVATLFEIETGARIWDIWEICCAFADQYEKLYEQPEAYGIWGSDLSSLWIENLVYYPEHRLIVPAIGS